MGTWEQLVNGWTANGSKFGRVVEEFLGGELDSVDDDDGDAIMKMVSFRG